MKHPNRFIVALVLLILIVGCTVDPRYNSLDLALLPCESGDSPVFFRAVEFDALGNLEYAEQFEDLRRRLQDGPPVTDLILFVHGWNKNPSSAELDYQNFLCRLHGRLRNIIGDEKRRGGLLVLGIFWPSTITNRPEEPLWLKPASYPRIRDRADIVAEKGLAKLLAEFTPDMERSRHQVPVRVHLIGHSFGGRMIVRSLEFLKKYGELVPFLTAADSVNVVLLNPAVSAARFDWINEAVNEAQRQKVRARFTESTASYLFNIHSYNDSANRFLFPVASVFIDDQVGCAAGACGVPSYPTLCVDASGKLQLDALDIAGVHDLSDRLNAWNIDATQIVFDHSDIYKGRVATLVPDLLYDKNVKQRFATTPLASNQHLASRCNVEKRC